ncbi:coagulation factor XIII, A1 polypeptide a, tandem duplicate 1 [Hoplias malabaricus]|uniref:coagulation factor XIII, A1 polypeptide a, tandem duplicate 1 n=1 Tax=Hoplias malabaricus TaxID=27720 RepID=UPI00346192F5
MSRFDPCRQSVGRMNSPIPCSNTVFSELPETEAYKPSPRAPPATGGVVNLSVTAVNMYASMNKVAHHTERYDNSNLIVRRAQEFTMGIVFNRPFNPQNDWVNIEFVIGNNPNKTQGTMNVVTLGGDNETDSWAGQILETRGTETRVGITPPSDSIIGLFNTYVTVITSSRKIRTKRNPKTDFYVLYNPWAPSDPVYVDSDSERAEYVLNDTGVIFNGTLNNITNRPWNYGQFKRGVLDACLFVLDFGKMPLQYRGDVLSLCRKASAMINSQDDNGVLMGNWSDDYSLGTAPSAWTGSAEILLQYAAKGGVPVKYAQCWVFAGTLNTFLRCFGLPTRLVTNYCSAHDSMGNIVTEIVLDEDGQLDTREATDSVWNYHCWNEVFTKRADLPAVYSGWQAVDATPQETSDGYYRCGPTSVRAIKEGQLSYQFDGRFLFAEVNSDVIFYKSDVYGNKTYVSRNTSYVGQLIVTKMLDSNKPMDITSIYKYPEGNPEDKRTMKTAESQGMTRYKTPVQTPDVQMALKASQINNSSDISLTLDFKNLSNEMRTININLTGKVDYYTGVTRSIFKIATKDVTLQPRQFMQDVHTVTAKEYMAFVVGEPFLSFIAHGLIKNTNLSITEMAVLYLNTPPLNIQVILSSKVSGITKVGSDMYVTVNFTNTFSYDLNNVSIRLEGSGFLPYKKKEYSQITRGSTVKWIETFTPQIAGSKTLIACLDCAAARNVCGHLDINIEESTNDELS